MENRNAYMAQRIETRTQQTTEKHTAEEKRNGHSKQLEYS